MTDITESIQATINKEASDILEATDHFLNPVGEITPMNEGGATVKKDKAGDLRKVRNDILNGSDWTQAVDSPLSDDKKSEWATYRQALRDITSDPSFPEVTFPSPPSV